MARKRRTRSTPTTTEGEAAFGPLASGRAVGAVSIVLTLAIGIGAVVVAFMMRAQDRRYDALVPRLQSVMGRIEGGSWERGSRGWRRQIRSYTRAEVVYSYEVGGRAFRGKNHTLNKPPEFGTPEEAQEFLARFPPGDPARVYYNPDDPGESALEPSFAPMGGFVWGAAILGLGLVGAAVNAAVRLRREMRDQPLSPTERRKTLRTVVAIAALGALAGAGVAAWDAWDRISHVRRTPHLRQAPGRRGLLEARSNRVEATYTYDVPGDPAGSRRGESWRFGRQTVDDPREAEAFKEGRDSLYAIEVWYDARNPADSALQPIHVPHLRARDHAALLGSAALLGWVAWAAVGALRRTPLENANE